MFINFKHWLTHIEKKKVSLEYYMELRIQLHLGVWALEFVKYLFFINIFPEVRWIFWNWIFPSK